MREIKFRGKSIKDETWVYGLLFKELYDSVSQTCIAIEPLSANDYSEIYSFCYEVIDSSTVGQFTGLYDKNGKDIYEGDIVKYIDARNIVNHLVVKWNEINACFDIGWARTDYVSNNGEVIGNIHENPKLFNA